MKNFLEEFSRTIGSASGALLRMTEDQAERRRAPGAWSPKEIVGHLIDSAANNHQRFVRAQFQQDLVFPGYAQDDWVAAQRYQAAPWHRLVDLWRLYNLHLLHLVSVIPEGELTRRRHPHSLHRIAGKIVEEHVPATLEYLIRDYLGHLKHHLGQIGPAGEAPPRV